MTHLNCLFSFIVRTSYITTNQEKFHTSIYKKHLREYRQWYKDQYKGQEKLNVDLTEFERQLKVTKVIRNRFPKNKDVEKSTMA